MESQKNRTALYEAQIIFRNALLPFIIRRLKAAYGDQAWERGVRRVFRREDIDRLEEQFRRRHTDASGRVVYAEDALYEILDFNYFPNVFEGNWKAAFKQVLDHRNRFMVWLRDVVDTRNAVAHPTSDDLDHDETWRTLDTMVRLLRQIDPDAGAEIDKIKQRVRNGDLPSQPPEPGASAPAAGSGFTEAAPASGPSGGHQLAYEQRRLLADIIEESGRARSTFQRNALLEEIGFDPGKMELDQGSSREFAITLVSRLSRTRNRVVLGRLVETMIDDVPAYKAALDKLRADLRDDPLAEAEEDVPGELPSHLIYPLDDAVVRSRPCDLGMVWGLNRGSFIGVLAGWRGQDLDRHLTYVDRLLAEVQDTLESPPALPRRRWHRATLEAPPGSIDPVQGVILDIAHDVPNALRRSRAWCRSLLNAVPQGQQIALIIHVTAPSIRGAREVARRIYTGLDMLDLAVPLDLRTFDYRPRGVGGAEAPSAASLLLERPPNQGGHFCSWVERAFEGQGLQQDVLQARFPLIIQAYRGRHQAEAVEDADAQSAALDVIRDLDALAPTYGDLLYAQFLELVADHLPQRLYETIGSYALSSREAARRCALIFCNKHRSDTLFDAWLHGVASNFSHVPKGRGLNADPETGFFVEGLVLSLLRAYQQGIDEVAPALNAIKPYLTRSLDFVADFVVQTDVEVTEEAFFKTGTGREFMLAARAGVTFRRLPQVVEALRLETPDLWWLCFAMPPSIDLLGALLRQGRRTRAVFGLCTPQEWHEIRLAKDVTRRISDCRRGPRLYYR